MAALICQKISSVFHACGEQMLSPFQSCGTACFNAGESLRTFARVICSPFFPYLAVTAVLNVPPMIWSAQGYTSTCTLSWWLWINGPLCLAHVIASHYIVHQIQRELGLLHKVQEEGPPSNDEKNLVEYQEMEAGGCPEKPIAISFDGKILDDGKAFAETPTRNLCTRLSRVLCYDAGVAIYILAALAWVAWQTLGMAMIFRVGGDFSNDICHVKRRIFLSLTCSWLYAMLVSVTFASSFLFLRK